MAFSVKKEISATFTDISLPLKRYHGAPEVLPLSDSDHIYVGYYKPFNQMFIGFEVVNDVDIQVQAEYFNGSTWELLEIQDETLGLKENGFILFEKPKDWSTTSVDGDSNFYVRLRPSTTILATTSIKVITILFSNDQDLIELKSNIVSKLNNGNNWITKHENTRDSIIQNINNLGNRKYRVLKDENPVFSDRQGRAISFSDINAWDLFEPFQLREAAKLITMSNIYLRELNDEIDDKYERQGLRYSKDGYDALNLFTNKIDFNDDGKESTQESEGQTETVLVWQ